MGSGVMAKRLAGLCPLGRCGVLKDVARVVAWLVGDESEWVNGQVRRLAYLGPSMLRVNRRLNQLLEQRSSWKLKSEAKVKQRFKDDSAYVSENRTLENRTLEKHRKKMEAHSWSILRTL